ncbi:MAG: tryptophan-rich sensory protein [Eubacteriales bacterium]|nr:tryptophan-rich sensory protein [Eubacteriales bacterium]MDD3349320.1 tryptophan-rich sensory protein [Eubacteriales bacterium]
MNFRKCKYCTRVAVVLSFLIMITANTLAVSLPLNDRLTGDISDAYPNLFAPAGITFSIWGVIYLLLAIYVFYQSGIFEKYNKPYGTHVPEMIGLTFTVSSLANAAWIFAWHYDKIALSLVFMILILLCLIRITTALQYETLSKREKIVIKLPFSIYFGWITVATIANVTVLLVRYKWNRFGLPEEAWMIMMLFVGAAIATVIILKNRDKAYGLVLIWAYVGIIIKHTSKEGYAFLYPEVIGAASVCILLFLILEVYLFFWKGRKKIFYNL